MDVSATTWTNRPSGAEQSIAALLIATAFPSPGPGSPTSRCSTSPTRPPTTGTRTPASPSAMFEREFAAYLGVAPRRRRAALHLGAAPRHAGPRHRPGRRGDRARVHLGGHRRAARLRRRDPGVRRHRPATRGASSADSLEQLHHAADQGDRHRRPLRRRSRHGRASRAVAAATGLPDHRGRRAGHRLDAGRAARPARSATSPSSASTAPRR